MVMAVSRHARVELAHRRLRSSREKVEFNPRSSWRGQADSKIESEDRHCMHDGNSCVPGLENGRGLTVAGPEENPPPNSEPRIPKVLVRTAVFQTAAR